MAPKLIAFPGSDDEIQLQLDDMPPVSLGRAATSDIVIERRMASRAHATIERTGDSWVLLDLGSYNGTWLNGRLVERANLADGDEIRIAGRRLRFIGEQTEEVNPLDAEETLDVSPAVRSAAIAAAAAPAWQDDDTTEELEVSAEELTGAAAQTAASARQDEDTTEELEVSADTLAAVTAARDDHDAQQPDGAEIEVTPEEAEAALEDLDLVAGGPAAAERATVTNPEAAEPPGELALTSEDVELLRHAQGAGSPVVPDAAGERSPITAAPEPLKKAMEQALAAASNRRLLYALALVALAFAVLILWSLLT